MQTLLIVSVFVGLLCCSYGQQISSQNVTFYCIKDTVLNQLKFDFRIVLKGDPQAFVTARDTNDSTVTGCTITYDSSIMVHTVKSVINLSNNQAVSNGCGFTVDATNTIFTWRIWYGQNPNDFTNANGGLNKKYRAICNVSSIPDNTETAAMSPLTPEIDVIVETFVPPLAFVVLYEDTNGVYQQVTSSTPSLKTGTKLRLQLQVNFGTFSASSIYGAGGLRVRAAGNSDFNNSIIFFNTTGCPSSIFAPTSSYGFLGPTTTVVSSPFLATTDPFLAWKFDDSNTVYFEVNFDTCIANTYNSDLFCRDPCNNPRTSSGRRRRNVEESEELTKVVSVRIYDPDELESNQQKQSDRTLLYVGMGVGVCALIALLSILVCFIMIRARRQQDEDESKKVPSEGFTNQVTY